MKPVTEKKGYVTLEAAVFLPVFILAVVSFVSFINIFSILENIYYSTFEEVSRAASKASVVKAAPALGYTLKSRVESDNPAVCGSEIEKIRYLYFDGNLDNMIAVDGKYTIDIDLPLGFGHEFTLTSSVKCRGFTGLRADGDPMSYDEMESEGIWDPVWIFPMSGEKYHGGTCTYVKANAREMVLTGEMQRKYEPCSLCNAAGVQTGSYVYCFIENGTVYHTDNCRQVQRYTLEINREEAVNKGYRPCSKCGGGIT